MEGSTWLLQCITNISKWLCCHIITQSIMFKSRKTLHIAPDSKVHGANMGPVGPRWAPCRPQEPCYLECRWNFLNENVWISIKIPLMFVPNGPINNISPLVQIKAWRRLGNKPLSEPMMVNVLTHICVTQPQWVNLNTILERSGWKHSKFSTSKKQTPTKITMFQEQIHKGQPVWCLIHPHFTMEIC